MQKKIDQLKIGEEAVIEGFQKGEGDYLQRLLAMGLTKGTKIKLLKIAPLGDPVEIEVRGFKLSLRKNEAQLLQLKGVPHE
ncbi:MAG TPA: FeoA family protein [Spirochaetota bacterium]|jgi:ferrous iron transport protein A|nr:MAG: Ferrous iron transport protein A [Spirochaetes bacterium ADurb.Bin133]HNZ25848.1 FeoA family protein [Spirochaetota bacterium]HPY86355.1 FeoA family protein [Spirochaetota bacterium]